MSVSDISNVVVAIVAVGGLALSIYNFYKDRKDKQPKLIVKLGHGFGVYGAKLGDPVLILNVGNAGEKKILINSVAIRWKKKNAIFPHGIDGDHKLPCELPPGEGAVFWTPLKEFAEDFHHQGASGKAKIKAYFTDGIGIEYFSNEFVVDIDGWIKIN